MKDSKYYNATGYPERIKKPVMGALTAGNARIFADAMDQYDKDMIVYCEAEKAYTERQAALHQEFIKDLFEEHGVENNPKAYLCFEKAWESGHAYGYGEVATHFSNLVDLIQ